MVRYIESIGMYSTLERFFGSIRGSKKGLPVLELFKQLFCFFINGTSFHMTRFDKLAEDKGYAGTIATKLKDMASSHQMKRFFKAFSFVRFYLFRHLLQRILIWRLEIKQPDVFILNGDTMVMDNDDAKKRHGVQPTYKKVKGFHPLQFTWERYVIDTVFRGGKKNSNHGDTVNKAVEHLVKFIRRKYRKDVPIIIFSGQG